MTYNTRYIERTLSRPAGREIWSAGVAAGLVAALVMALFAMIVSAARGAGFFMPMRLIAGLFLGVLATATSGAVVLGIAIHLAVGAAFGVLFAAILSPDMTALAKLGAGLLYGLGIYVVMTFLIVPWFDPLLSARLAAGWFLLYHLAYGVTLVGALDAARRTARIRREPGL